MPFYPDKLNSRLVFRHCCLGAIIKAKSLDKESFVTDPGEYESPKPPRLLDEARRVLRLNHYSIHTERSYLDWIVRYVRYYRMRCRADLQPAEARIEQFLTHLAIDGQVAPATSNQAMPTNTGWPA
jgi:hypothetical protein